MTIGRAGICSDRALEKAIQLRLDLLYFIDHDIGEAPPDHSTICKTRKRIPTELFEKVFSHVLGLCVSVGLVKGEIQSIDTAYIPACPHLNSNWWRTGMRMPHWIKWWK